MLHNETPYETLLRKMARVNAGLAPEDEVLAQAENTGRLRKDEGYVAKWKAHEVATTYIRIFCGNEAVAEVRDALRDATDKWEVWYELEEVLHDLDLHVARGVGDGTEDDVDNEVIEAAYLVVSATLGGGR